MNPKSNIKLIKKKNQCGQNLECGIGKHIYFFLVCILYNMYPSAASFALIMWIIVSPKCLVTGREVQAKNFVANQIAHEEARFL